MPEMSDLERAARIDELAMAMVATTKCRCRDECNVDRNLLIGSQKDYFRDRIALLLGEMADNA